MSAPVPLRVTYDAEVDAAYVYFRRIDPGEIAWTCDWLYPTLLDFGRDGALLGVECLDPREVPADWLAAAVPPGTPWILTRAMERL